MLTNKMFKSSNVSLASAVTVGVWGWGAEVSLNNGRGLLDVCGEGWLLAARGSSKRGLAWRRRRGNREAPRRRSAVSDRGPRRRRRDGDCCSGLSLVKWLQLAGLCVQCVCCLGAAHLLHECKGQQVTLESNCL